MNKSGSDQENRHITILFEKYLEGDLTQEEADDLIVKLKADPLLIKKFRENLRADFLLHKIFRQRKDLQNKIFDSSDLPNSKEENTENLFDNPEELKKYLEWERNVQPLSDSSVPRLMKKEESFIRKETLSPLSGRRKNPHFNSKTKKHSDIPFIILLIILLGIIVGLPIDHEIEKKKQKSLELLTSNARIIELIDVEWGKTDKSLKRGQILGPSEIALEKGIVKIQTACGTELILEGPGHWVLNGDKNLFCGKGLTSAHVPPEGIGFEILTPFASFIDQGTEFFVDVVEDAAQINVIKGKVDSLFSRGEKINLVSGDAFQVDHKQKGKKIEYAPHRYISSEIFNDRLVRFVEKITSQRKKNEIVLDRDSRLLVRFDFSKDLLKQIPNRSARGRDEIPSGIIRNCRLGEGSLYGTKSIQLKRKDSVVEINGNKQYRSLTLITRIRIDQLYNQGNILFSSEGFLRKQGAFLWQITQSGSLQFQLTPQEFQVTFCIDSPVFLTKDLWGTWAEVALVVDEKTKTVRHYLDGNLIESQPWIPEDLFIGSAVIGNRGKGYQGMNDRFLGGAMEEFLIYDTALTDKEIANIFNLSSKQGEKQ